MGSGVLVAWPLHRPLMINRLVVDREQLLIVAISIAFMDYGLPKFWADLALSRSTSPVS